MLGVEFKKYINLHFLPQNYLPLEWDGVMKFIIFCLLTLQMLHTNLVKIGPVVLENKFLMDDSQSTADANQ